jgi:hypothetical protein
VSEATGTSAITTATGESGITTAEA